jgi:CBS domain-containing protein
MTISNKVRPHKMTPGVKLCVPGTYNPIGPDSPAVEAMTDFTRISVVTIAADATLANANTNMISRGVRLLLVKADDDRLLGLITARDIQGERPLQIAQTRGVRPAELLVSDLMVPANQIDIAYFREVVYARVVDILDAMKMQGRQHILVEDSDPVTGEARVRGIFSATQIGRLMGVPVQGFEVASTFAEIEAALAD